MIAEPGTSASRATLPEQGQMVSQQESLARRLRSQVRREGRELRVRLIV